MSPSSADAPPFPAATHDASSHGGEITLIGILNLALRNRRLIVGVASLGLLLMVVPSLLAPRKYTSRGSFVLASRQAKSGLAALAAQYGVQMSTDEPAQNPNFYVDLIRSHQILAELAGSSFPASGGNRSLVDLLEIQGSTPEIRRERAIDKLRSSVQANTVLKTGVVNFSVTSTNPKLAQQIATRLLEILNRFNVETRQSQAASERKFTEQRLGEVRVSLRNAEDRLIQYLQRNRIAFSPELQYSIDRMQREISQQHGLYGTLQSAYEQARIDEVRDTPLLTIIDVPVAAIRPDTRAIAAKGLLGLVIGAMLGLMIGATREQFVRPTVATQQSPEVREFVMLREETVADLRGLGGIFSRRSSSGSGSAERGKEPLH